MTRKDALQLVAIAGAVKEAELAAAKRLLSEGKSHEIDITARFRGVVSKGLGVPASSGSRPATVELYTNHVLFHVFEALGVEPTAASLGKLLRAAAKKKKPAASTAEYQRVFDEVAQALAAKLPAVKFKSPGRSGAVHSDIQVEVLEGRPAKAA